MAQYVEIEITQGNINNEHLYLSSVIDFFPKESIGGGNVREAARRTLEVHNGLGDPIATDIAGDKKIFRKRSWVGDFFRAHDIREGDRVVIEKTGPSRYHVYPKRG